MTHEEFREHVSGIPNNELAEKATKSLRKLCSTGRRSFTMSVPPRFDDTDIILSEIIVRFQHLTK